MNIASTFIIGGLALLQVGSFVPVQADSCADFTGTCTAPEIVDAGNWCNDACTEADCCDRPNCESFTGSCTAPLVPADSSSIKCDTVPCTALECCEPETCRSYTGSCTAPLVRASSAFTDYMPLCTTIPCSAADCCVPQTCEVDFPRSGWIGCTAPKVETYHHVQCAADCTAAECCVQQTCAMHVVIFLGASLCPSTTTPLPAYTTCAGTTCTDAECCGPLDDFDGAIGPFSSSPMLTVVGAVAVAIIAVPLL